MRNEEEIRNRLTIIEEEKKDIIKELSNCKCEENEIILQMNYHKVISEITLLKWVLGEIL